MNPTSFPGVRRGDGASAVRALGRAVRAVPLVAVEVTAQEFLGAAGVRIAARQRDPLLQQPLGEHQSTAVEERNKGGFTEFFLHIYYRYMYVQTANARGQRCMLASGVLKTRLLLPREARQMGHTLI